MAADFYLYATDDDSFVAAAAQVHVADLAHGAALHAVVANRCAATDAAASEALGVLDAAIVVYRDRRHNFFETLTNADVSRWMWLGVARRDGARLSGLCDVFVDTTELPDRVDDATRRRVMDVLNVANDASYFRGVGRDRVSVRSPKSNIASGHQRARTVSRWFRRFDGAGLVVGIE